MPTVAGTIPQAWVLGLQESGENKVTIIMHALIPSSLLLDYGYNVTTSLNSMPHEFPAIDYDLEL